MAPAFAGPATTIWHTCGAHNGGIKTSHLARPWSIQAPRGCATAGDPCWTPDFEPTFSHVVHRSRFRPTRLPVDTDPFGTLALGNQVQPLGQGGPAWVWPCGDCSWTAAASLEMRQHWLLPALRLLPALPLLCPRRNPHRSCHRKHCRRPLQQLVGVGALVGEDDPDFKNHL